MGDAECVLGQDRDRLARVRPADAKSLPGNHNHAIAEYSAMHLLRPGNGSRRDLPGRVRDGDFGGSNRVLATSSGTSPF